MERMVNKRLQNHLERNNLINPSQSGFRKNRSTEDQVALLAQEVENAFQMKMKTLAVFVDLTKAFDKVWKEGLLLKLLRKDIGGNMYKWIESYLFQRTARVRLDGHRSHLVKIKEGVPQGGVISPTLFIIFIDDIVDKLSRNISRALHADDLAVWTSAESTPTARYLMQQAMDNISKWAKDWLVEINRTKTESTCFSLATSKEEWTLKLDGADIPKQDTPTYLGVKLDTRMTWSPHLSDIEKKATKKLSIMKKLAGTKWGANGKILKQVYTSTVRPHLEYSSSAWTTAAKTNTERLNKVQNASMRLITGGMRSTPIAAMEQATGLQPLEERREEKVIRQAEKMKRIPAHPLNRRLQEPTKNRLKRKSINHISKSLRNRFPEVLLPNQPFEELKDYEEWETCEHNIRFEIPGIRSKEEHSKDALKALTLETLDQHYPAEKWAHIYTDGSAEDAVRNGGGGIHMRFPNGTRISKAVPTGKLSSNFRAEACALLEAIKTLNSSEQLPSNTVILTDCKSMLQSVQGSRDQNQLMQSIRRELTSLSQKTNLVMQWIPAHCDIKGNEEADRLSKEGSKASQEDHPIPYSEAKTLIRNCFHSSWRARLGPRGKDEMGHLTRKQQTIIFRLRTGHCRLLAHLNRIRISHTDECPCGTEPQTPEHILQSCSIHDRLRQATWPDGEDLQEKLWGAAESLRRTADFINATKMDI